MRADAEVDVDQVVARARSADVRVESLAAYAATSPPIAGLVVGYGALGSDQIRPGLERRAACASARRGRGGP